MEATKAQEAKATGQGLQRCQQLLIFSSTSTMFTLAYPPRWDYACLSALDAHFVD